MTTLTEFLFPAPARRESAQILAWWERRRLQYNIVMLATGVFSLGMMRVITWLPPNAHHDFIPLPLILFFGVMANVCYTLGPITEIAIEKLWGRKLLPVGPTLFRMGLTFSLGLTLLPTLITVFDWGFRILRSIF